MRDPEFLDGCLVLIVLGSLITLSFHYGVWFAVAAAGGFAAWSVQNRTR